MKNISRIITIALGIILCASLFTPLHDHATADACEEAPQSFDLSVIENWCGSGTERGSIRFVGAEVYARKGNTLTLIDEQGNLWKKPFPGTPAWAPGQTLPGCIRVSCPVLFPRLSQEKD